MKAQNIFEELDVSYSQFLEASRHPKGNLDDILITIDTKMKRIIKYPDQTINNLFLGKKRENEIKEDKKKEVLKEEKKDDNDNFCVIEEIKNLLLKRGSKYKEEHNPKEIIMFFIFMKRAYFITISRKDGTFLRFKSGIFSNEQGKNNLYINYTKLEKEEIKVELDKLKRAIKELSTENENEKGVIC